MLIQMSGKNFENGTVIIEESLYVDKDGNSTGDYAKPAVKQDTAISAIANGTYKPTAMTFEDVVVTAGGTAIDASNYTVAWTAGTGTIVSNAPTTAGTYTATVTITNTTDYNQPTPNTVTYTIDKATPHVVVPIAQTIVTTSDKPSTKLDAQTNFSAQYSNGDTTAVAGTFAWADNSNFTSSTLTRVVNFTPADGTNYNTATGSYAFVMEQSVPAVTTGNGAMDATSGGLKFTFTEPTGANADKISNYTVNMYEKGQSTVIATETVAKGAGATTGFTVTDLTKAVPGKTYVFEVVSNSTTPGYASSTSAKIGEKQVEKASITMTAEPDFPLDLAPGYTTNTLENNIKITVKNTSAFAAKGITMPALGSDFVSETGGSEHLWSTAPFNLNAGASKEFYLQLAANKPAGTYTWSIENVGGTNTNTAAAITVKAVVRAPGQISSINATVPNQPATKSTVTAPSVNVTAGGTLKSGSASWNKSNGAIWGKGNTPVLTFTVQAASGKVFADSLNASNVTITGASTYATVTDVTLNPAKDEATVEVTYTEFKAVEKAAAAAIGAEKTSGALKLTFTEPSDKTGIKDYTVQLQTEGGTNIGTAKTVALGAGASGVTYALDSSIKADGSTKYKAVITSNVATDKQNLYEADIYDVTAATIPQATLTVNVSSPAKLTYGYQNGNTITVTVTNTNAAVDAIGVKLPSLSGTGFTGSNWPTSGENIQNGTPKSYTLKLDTGKDAGTYTAPIAILAGTNFSAPGSVNAQQVVDKAAQVITVQGGTSIQGKDSTNVTFYAKLMQGTAEYTGAPVITAAKEGAGTVITNVDATGAYVSGKGFPITVTLAGNPDDTQKLNLNVPAGTNYGAADQVQVTFEIVNKDPLSVTFSTGGTYTGAAKLATVTKLEANGSTVTLTPDTDYEVQYDLGSGFGTTAPTNAGTYQVKLVLKSTTEGDKYAQPMAQDYTIGKATVTSALKTTGISAADKTLAHYFHGFTNPTGSNIVVSSDAQFKGVGTETALSGTFALTDSNTFETVVTQGTSYSWTFTDNSGNYEVLSGTVTPWAAPAPTPPSGGGGGTATHTVTYDAGEHGKITSGKSSESVESGKFPTNVPTVTADQGWRFTGWTLKGKKDLVKPEETKITSSTTFVAQYEEFTLAFNKELLGAYVQGDDLGLFNPDRNITRGEVAAILARTLTVKMDPARTYFNNQYPDVDKDIWYAEYVGFLTELGVITGNDDGTFAGDRLITREEFVTMVMRVDGLASGENPFGDVSESNWGYKYIIASNVKGYVIGREDGGFHPEAYITRSEVVKIMNRALDLSGITGTMKFSDVPADHWAFNEILAASTGRTELNTPKD